MPTRHKPDLSQRFAAFLAEGYADTVFEPELLTIIRFIASDETIASAAAYFEVREARIRSIACMAEGRINRARVVRQRFAAALLSLQGRAVKELRVSQVFNGRDTLILQDAGFETIGDIVRRGRPALGQTKGIRKSTMGQVDSVLKFLGVEWSG